MIIKVAAVLLILKLVDFATADDEEKNEFFKSIANFRSGLKDLFEDISDYQFNEYSDSTTLGLDCQELYTKWHEEREKRNYDESNYNVFFDEFCEPLIPQIKKCYHSLYSYFKDKIKGQYKDIHPTIQIEAIHHLLLRTCFHKRSTLWMKFSRDKSICIKEDFDCSEPINHDEKDPIIYTIHMQGVQDKVCNKVRNAVNCRIEYFKECKDDNIHKFYYKFYKTIYHEICGMLERI